MQMKVSTEKNSTEQKKQKTGAWWRYVELPSHVVVFVTALIKLFLPETFKAATEGLAMDIINAFDYRLIPWVFVLNIIGYWGKRMNLPKWVPPMPLLIMLSSFLICCGFGWAHTDVTGAKAVFVAVVEYGLGNGAIVAMLAIFGYDSVHAFTKKRGLAKSIDSTATNTNVPGTKE